MQLYQIGKDLEERIQFYKKYYLNHLGGRIPHIDSRYEQGWIPMDIVLYTPLKEKFFGRTSELGIEIIDSLEEKGEYVFSEEHHTKYMLLSSLGEVMFTVPQHIKRYILHNGADRFMLDRKAYDLNGRYTPIKMQWYAKE